MTGESHDAQAISRRLRSLKDVVLSGRKHGDVDSFLREFLDEFYSEGDQVARALMLSEEPRKWPGERRRAGSRLRVHLRRTARWPGNPR